MRRHGSGRGERRSARRRGAIAARWVLAMIFAGAAPSARALDFSTCLADLRAQAPSFGVQPASFARYADHLQPNDAPRFLHEQPEFEVPIWDYLGGLVDDQRIRDGLERMRSNAETLARIERRFGVDRHIVAAVWGVETDYGRKFGKRPVVQSLASLACSDSRRRSYFRTEFFAALRILQNGEAPPDRFYGSWAGAFGQTQFMPTTFFRSAVDMDGGRLDIIDSAPDALASTANYLRQHGWIPGLKWGFEVRVPASFKGSSGRFHKRPMSYWAARGLRRMDGAAPAGGYAGLFAPEGTTGPAFLVTRNFEVLTSYNSAEAYGLAIGLLADRLSGDPPLRTPWPGGEIGLSRAERRDVQAILIRRGYDVGENDGVLGEKSRAAIAQEERRLGMTPDGWASRKLLARLLGAP